MASVSSTNLVGALSLFENRNLVKPVVDSLLKDQALLNDCSRFVDALQLPIVYSTSIKRLLANPNAGSYYETVQQAMAHWVGSNGADATVSNLSAILLGSEFVSAAQRLQSDMAQFANPKQIVEQQPFGFNLAAMEKKIYAASQITYNILMETFNRDMSSELFNSEEGMTTVVFQTAFQAIKNSVLGKFEEFQLVDQGMHIEYREKLSNSIQQVYEQYCRTNRQKRRTYLAHMSLSNGLLTRTKELLLAARNELVAIDYNIYVVRSILKVEGPASKFSRVFGFRGAWDMDEAVFNVEGYQGALESLKSKVAQFERVYIDSTVDFDRVVRPAAPFSTLKNELDIIRAEFVTFDWTNYSIKREFLRHGNIRMFKKDYPALYGDCTVFDTAKYANDVKAAADKLDQGHSRYFEAVVSSVRLDLEESEN